GRVQVTDGAGDGAEIVGRKFFRHVGVVERLPGDGVENFCRHVLDHALVASLTCRIALAVDVVVDLGALGVGVGDALVIFARDVFRNGGVDADLGAGRHHAKTLRQAGVERLCPRVGDDHHVAVALHAGGNGPFDLGRIVDVDIVVDHD